MPSPSEHRATYDEQGNIILPGDDHADVPQAISEPSGEATIGWTLVEEAQEEHEEQRVEPEATPPHSCEENIERALDTEENAASGTWNTFGKDVREKLAGIMSEAIAESGRQYVTSMADSQELARNFAQEAHAWGKKFLAFLTQPVWVPGRRNTVRTHTRGTLFLLDVVRFGGTFASLFVLLFVGMNYQSFWEILQSNMDPLADLRSALSRDKEGNFEMAEKLKRIPSLSTAGKADGDLLSLVPRVGPPRNMLIIPKLRLHVPIQSPPTDALLREDWKKLEEDIQSSLRFGVVHYPGTARPGQGGNFFITGHSSYFPWAGGNYKSVFARLAQLNVGDEYWVFYRGDKYRYIVQEKKEVKPSEVSVLDQPIQRRLSTLMTCTPVGTALRRLIIVAQEVDPASGLPIGVGEHSKPQDTPKIRAEMLPI